MLDLLPESDPDVRDPLPGLARGDGSTNLWMLDVSSGADQLGYRWAWKHQVKHQLFRADWERFGKSAGVRRNYQMAQAGDMLLAFWDGRSAGTQHLISCMQQLGKPVVVIRTDGQA